MPPPARIPKCRQRGIPHALPPRREEGRLAGVHGMLTDLLMERFGPLSWSMGSRLAAVSNEGELRRLARVAVRASSLAELVREIQRD